MKISKNLSSNISIDSPWKQATPCSRLIQTLVNLEWLILPLPPRTRLFIKLNSIFQSSKPINERKPNQTQNKSQDQMKPRTSPKKSPSSCTKSESCPAVIDRSGPRSHRATAKGHSLRNWRRLFASGVLSPCLTEASNC